ncbi:MAG: alkaline phosphatase family protein, partial [Candidatus Promineifilaceae bacterium]
SILTGVNPGKHGIFDMTLRRPGSYESELLNGSHRRAAPFWQALNQAGYRVGLVNVPFTYPPAALDGFALCGFGAPADARKHIYPASLQARVEAEVEGYRPELSSNFLQRAGERELLEAERRHQARQIAAVAVAVREQPVQVLVINLMLVDHANHYASSMLDVNDAIRRSDEHLGQLLEAFRPDNVLLISDHGSRRIESNFLLFAWLRDRGYLSQKPAAKAARPAAMNWLLQQWLPAAAGPKRLLRSGLRRLALALPEAALAGLLSRLERRYPGAGAAVLYDSQLDYSRSSLITGTAFSEILYFNCRGREPAGVVEPAEAAELGARLQDELGEVIDPGTGRPLFSAVCHNHEVYAGPWAAWGPDMILDSMDSACGVLTSDYRDYPLGDALPGRYFISNQSRRDFGRHAREGIFVFAGPQFDSGAAGQSYSVMDVPATLLHMYGVRPPAEYDGRVMREAFA